jgi:hypothetical protein
MIYVFELIYENRYGTKRKKIMNICNIQNHLDVEDLYGILAVGWRVYYSRFGSSRTSAPTKDSGARRAWSFEPWLVGARYRYLPKAS